MTFQGILSIGETLQRVCTNGSMTGAVTKVQHIAPPKADELQLKARAAGSKVQKPELTKAGPLGLMSLQVCTAL